MKKRTLMTSVRHRMIRMPVLLTIRRLPVRICLCPLPDRTVR